MTYNLRPLWDAILDLYGRFDAYCKKHGLRYYVTGGTLLGAVRHNGFIPWDDDFDVVMPRPDYTKFIEIYDQDPIPSVELWTHARKATWPYLFAKILDRQSDLIASVERDTGLELGTGIAIDIIPIDGMPKSLFPFYFWALKRTAWLHAKEGDGFPWSFLNCLLWRDDSPAAFEKWLSKYDYSSSPCVEDYNANARRFRLRALNASSFGTPVMHRFENVEVPMPQEWDKFLRIIFGNDYMSLPPESMRKPSHSKKGS